jgi:hypothetical protein
MPVLSVDGEFVVGFDPARIDELLAGGVKEESSS